MFSSPKIDAACRAISLKGVVSEKNLLVCGEPPLFPLIPVKHDLPVVLAHMITPLPFVSLVQNLAIP